MKILIKLKTIIRSLEVKFQYSRIALNNIRNPHIGDTVTFNKTKCCLIQGVANPYWDLLPLTEENLSKDNKDIWKRIHKNGFKLESLLKRFIFSFMFTYKFYMLNWYSIDIRQKGKISFIIK